MSGAKHVEREMLGQCCSLIGLAFAVALSLELWPLWFAEVSMCYLVMSKINFTR